MVEREKNEGCKAKPKIVCKKEQCGCASTFDLLSITFSHDDLIKPIFISIGLRCQYVPKLGPSPTATAFWTGPGYVPLISLVMCIKQTCRGCTNTPFKIATDPQWEVLKATPTKTPKSVNEVKVNVSLKEWKKWKQYDDDSVSVFVCFDYISLTSPIRKMISMKGLRYVCFDAHAFHLIHTIIGPQCGEIHHRGSCPC